MPEQVHHQRYLGMLGWRSCLPKYRHELPDSLWGYWLLLIDVAKINRLEDRFVAKHGYLPEVGK